MRTTDPATDLSTPHRSLAVRWSARALLGVLWVSIGAFGLAILGSYVRQAVTGELPRWNEGILPGLFDPDHMPATVGMGLHFATGAVLVLLIPLQLFASLRRRYPRVHRWSGRVSVAAALLAGVGGLGFILSKGTIGGMPMDIGFSLYGVLIILAAANTFRFARMREWALHRAWAIRLFALAIASWLYRVEYAGWSIATHAAGRTRNFDGPFDVFMSFFFYLGALAVAEAYIRTRRGHAPALVNALSATTLLGATAIVGVLTWFLVLFDWGPGVLALFGKVPNG